MRALRDFNIPKIVTDDLPVFMGLIGDLFPTLNVPRKRDMTFEGQIRTAMLDLRLQPEDSFILKVRTLSIFTRTLPVFCHAVHKVSQNKGQQGISSHWPVTTAWGPSSFSDQVRIFAKMFAVRQNRTLSMTSGDCKPLWIQCLEKYSMC